MRRVCLWRATVMAPRDGRHVSYGNVCIFRHIQVVSGMFVLAERLRHMHGIRFRCEGGNNAMRGA